MIFLPALFLAIGTVSASKTALSYHNMGADIEIDDKGKVKKKSSYGKIQRLPTHADKDKFGLFKPGAISYYLMGTYDDLGNPDGDTLARTYLDERDLDDDLWEKEFYSVGIPDVKLTVTSTKVEVIESSLKPISLKSAIMENKSNVGGTFKTEIYDEVENTRTTSWTETMGFEFTQSFSYDFKLLGSGGGGETSFGFSTEWSKGEDIADKTMVGSSSGVEVYLEPGDGVHIELVAERGHAKIKTTYEIALEGDLAYVACPRDGSKTGAEKCWVGFDDIQTVLETKVKSGSNQPYSKPAMPSKFVVTEINEVGYYAKDTVRMWSMSTNKYLVDYEEIIDV